MVQGFRSAGGFVGQVVRPAAVGVDGGEVPDEASREQQRCDGEVLAVRLRDVGAISTRFAQRNRGRKPPARHAWPPVLQFAREVPGHTLVLQSSRHTPCAVTSERHTECAYYLLL